MSEHGLMDNGITPYIPRVNCIHCGRFIGRDGSLNIETFEMSNEIASLDGECGLCLRRHAELVPQVERVVREWKHYDRWLTALNIRNVIVNSGGERYGGEEVQRATWSLPQNLIERDVRWGMPVVRWKASGR